MKRTLRICAALCALAAVPIAALPIAGFAADHGDAPSASDEPTADITDLYAWMDSRDANKLNLVLAVSPGAGDDDQFSDQVTYVFTINSKDAFGGDDGPRTDIKCHFPDGNAVECWAGNQYVIGDASSEEGLSSAEGGLRVFAGPRNDPFFLEYEGFGNAVNLALTEVAEGRVTMQEEGGCPVLSEEQQAALVDALTNGGDPQDTFAGSNVLALVLQVDKNLIAGDGDILAVWGATHSK